MTSAVAAPVGPPEIRPLSLGWPRWWQCRCFGRLGDLFGRRRLLLVGIRAFGVGSLICALAHSIGLLIAGRICPAESGYTDAFVMGAIASGCALLASPLLPGRR